MTWESGSTDEQRLRAGWAVLSIGVAILLLAWGLAAVRGPQGHGEVAVRHEKIDPPPSRGVLPAMTLYMYLQGMVLVVVLFISVIALVRVSRRYRQHLLKHSPGPSATADVWRMHRVPDASDDDTESDSGS